jgi:hypothetical protein
MTEEQRNASHCIRSNSSGDANFSASATMRAICVVHLAQTWAHALSGHFDDAEFTDRRERTLCTIDL